MKNPRFPTSHLHQTIVNANATGRGEVNEQVNLFLIVAEDVHGQWLVPG